MKQETTPYVTYNQFISYFLALIALLFTVFSLYAAHIATKVPYDLYNRDFQNLSAGIQEIKTIIKSNQEQISLISRNQLLVLRQLKIAPAESIPP